MAYVVSTHRDFIGEEWFAVCKEGDDWRHTVMLVREYHVAIAEARKRNGNARTPKVIPYNPDIPRDGNVRG